MKWDHWLLLGSDLRTQICCDTRRPNNKKVKPRRKKSGKQEVHDSARQYRFSKRKEGIEGVRGRGRRRETEREGEGRGRRGREGERERERESE